MNFRQWQAWRKAGGGRSSDNTEAAIKKILVPSVKPKKDK